MDYDMLTCSAPLPMCLNLYILSLLCDGSDRRLFWMCVLISRFHLYPPRFEENYKISFTSIPLYEG